MSRSNDELEKKPRKDSRRSAWRIGLGTIFPLCLSGFIFVAIVLMLTGRTVPLPTLLRDNVLVQINKDIGEGRFDLGAMSFGLMRDGVPRILLSDVRLQDGRGGAAAQLNELDVQLSLENLIRGQVAASSVRLSGAQITLRRTVSGDFAFSNGATAENLSLKDILGRIDLGLAREPLSTLNTIEAAGVVVALEDARSGRLWQASNAGLRVRRSENELTVSLASDVFNGTDDLAEIQISATLDRKDGRISVGANLDKMLAADIALQAPALSWLQLLDAPISGAVRAEIDETGALSSLAGTLDIDEGVLQPSSDTPPVLFSSAKTYFDFDPKLQRINFSNLSIAAQDGSLKATGHSYLTEFSGPWPGAFVSQFSVDEFVLDRNDLFPKVIRLGDIQADMRLRLDPFSVEFAQVAVTASERPISGNGRVGISANGAWQVNANLQTDEMMQDEVLTYWPLPVSKITRGWIAENLKTGRLLKPELAIRHKSGQKEPDVALSFDFSEGEVRLLSQMPRLDKARGRAVLNNGRFTLVLESGGVSSELGRVAANGSVFSVPDVKKKPAPAVVDLVAVGALQPALQILNNPPLRVMDRAKRSINLASARAKAKAHIELPLKSDLEGKDVYYQVAAHLMEMQSETLVDGRKLTSKGLDLQVTPDAVRIAGPAKLDGVPLVADYRQLLGENSTGESQVSGTVTLDRKTVEAFNLPLPSEQISGRSKASFDIEMKPDRAPVLALTSDLVGLGLSFPGFGWTKSKTEAGNLSLLASLGEVPEIEKISLETKGLSVDGSLSLTREGTLGEAKFDSVRAGDWLDAQVTLTPSEGGKVSQISVDGGRIDLRAMNFSETSGSSKSAPPIDLNLDHLVVSDGISLSPFKGKVERGNAGLSGRFQAGVNGRTNVIGTLAPANGGTAVRLQSNDASGVLRDSGLTPNGDGGTFDLILTPVVGEPSGTYDGEFLIEDFRLRKAPVMADLLDAISVVGLIDQLDGPGIRFETLDSRFRMNKNRLLLRRASAVGGSIGISADGVYDLARKRLDFRGVISPVYFLNGIGSIFTRRGEGLFGFNYRMAGAARDPQIRVNPLSILTPGAFREIFRSDPPAK